MKKIKYFLFMTLLFCSVESVRSQSALFLMISPSPAFNGMGQAGEALASSDPTALYFNPAVGTLFSDTGINISHQNSRTPWLPRLVGDMWLNYSASLVQIAFPQTSQKPGLLTTTMTFGISRTYLDAGKQQHTGSQGEDLGIFHVYFISENTSLGFGFQSTLFRMPLEAGFGVTYKEIFQQLGAVDNSNYRAYNSALDLGVLTRLTVPIKLNRFGFSGSLNFSPALGYSISNIGASVSFNDPDLADPLPRTARLGLAFEIDMILRDGTHPFSIRIARSAQDELIDYVEGSWAYSKDLADLDIYRDVVLQDESTDVIVNHGWEFGVAELYWLRFGRYIDTKGRLVFDTRGIEVRFLKLLPRRIISPSWGTLVDQIHYFADISYIHSNYTDIGPSHPIRGTSFQTIQVRVKHFDELMGLISPRK